MRKLKIISAFTLCVFYQFANSQQIENLVQLTGDVGLYFDFYHMESDPLGAIAPRRPRTLGRLVVNATIDIKDFSIPISMALPTKQYSGILPIVPATPNAPFKNFGTLIKNPLNRVGIAPKYKWIQVLLGSQIPQYSELSVGDLAVFGAGIILSPGKFRFSYFGGTSQVAVKEDYLNQIKGIYSRKNYSAKIGYGEEETTHVFIIGSFMKDDTSSLEMKPENVLPQAGIVSAVDFRINVGESTYVKGEVAGSAFTRDIRSTELPGFTPALPNFIFTPKASSRVDYASILTIGTERKNFGIKIAGKYYGDGFVPLGYPFLQTDRMDVTIDPHFLLLKNKLQFSGSIGRRVNNLSGIRATTTTQTIGSANANLQITEKLSLVANYSNFGFRNSIVNDTFRVEMITVSWSISPSYSIATENSIHNFTLMYSQNTFNDFNTISGATNNNDASNGVFSYILSMVKTPLSVTTLISYFKNKTSYGRLLTNSVNLSIGYRFFKKKLNTTAGLTLANSKINISSSGTQLMTILGTKYTFQKKIDFSVRGSINIFKYGETRPGISYRESLLRTSITYKL